MTEKRAKVLIQRVRDHFIQYLKDKYAELGRPVDNPVGSYALHCLFEKDRKVELAKKYLQQEGRSNYLYDELEKIAVVMEEEFKNNNS